MAIAVGAIAVRGLVRHRLALVSPFWRMIGPLNGDFRLVGYAIIGLSRSAGS